MRRYCKANVEIEDKIADIDMLIMENFSGVSVFEC